MNNKQEKKITTNMLKESPVSQELFDTLAYINTDEHFTREAIYKSLFEKKDDLNYNQINIKE